MTKKNVIKRTVPLMTIILLCAMDAGAQEPDRRHVTPVVPQTNQVKPPPPGTDEEVIQQYISGDSAAALAQLRKDSLRRVYTRYPRLTDFTVGLNIAEPLFMAFGQSYASADVSATVNMWNRLQPTIEVGLGWASNTPDGMNFSYRGKPSPYIKLGANYNFLFKNTPDYQVLAGLRLGYSSFVFDVTDVHYRGSYWREDADFDISGERSHALWGELGLGIRVKLLERFSLGWMIRYHGLLDYGKDRHARPWFIPGYGPRGSSLGFSLGIYYTLPLHGASSPSPSTSAKPQPSRL